MRLFTKLVTPFVFFSPIRHQVYQKGVYVRYFETRLPLVVALDALLLCVVCILILVMCDNFPDTYSLYDITSCCYELMRVVARYAVFVLHVI